MKLFKSEFEKSLPSEDEICCSLNQRERALIGLMTDEERDLLAKICADVYVRAFIAGLRRKTLSTIGICVTCLLFYAGTLLVAFLAHR